MNKELAKTLTLALVNYIDKNRPEGTMDCSSGECVSLEKAFTEENFDSVETLINKKLSRLTEFEEKLVSFALQCNGEFDAARKEAAKWSKELLDLAKKELAKRDEVITFNNLGPYDKGFQDGKAETMANLKRTFECNPDKLPKWLKDRIDSIKFKVLARGYNKGYKDAEKQYNESVSYHFPTMPTTPVFGCDGIHCTNPQMDCINCPMKTTGGGFSTSSGTSTATLHGNTSATDGKEHNPSFTD